MHQDRVNTREASELLRRDIQTLAHWRNKGIGPTYHKVGRFVFYLREDIDAYIESQTTRP